MTHPEACCELALVALACHDGREPELGGGELVVGVLGHGHDAHVAFDEEARRVAGIERDVGVEAGGLGARVAMKILPTSASRRAPRAGYVIRRTTSLSL
jgi:hypothetical protein